MIDLTQLSHPKLGLPPKMVAALGLHDIYLAQQVVDLGHIQPNALRRILRTDPAPIISKIVAKVRPIPDTAGATQLFLPPINGIVPPSLDAASARPDRTALIDAAVNALGSMPDRVALESHMPPVFFQHNSGTCVGMAVAGWRSFFLNTAMSGEFIYSGAKTLDPFGPHQEGTLLRCGMEFVYRSGAVRSKSYDYDAFIDGRPIAPLFAEAATRRISGYSALTDGLLDYTLMPKLLCAVLAGRLIPGVGPRPIPISTPVYPSMLGRLANATGIMNMPLPGETSSSGHAWCITGAISANHPDAPGGRDWFIVRNSWSRGYAKDNPLDLPGHALFPQRFFAQRANLFEVFLGLAEPSPAHAIPPHKSQL